MQTTQGIDPTTIRLADLDVMEVPNQMIVKPTLPRVTKRDAQHEILGAIKIIARLNGMSMVEQVHPTELLVRRIDQLEDEAAQREKDIQALIEKYEAEKSHYQQSTVNEIAGYKKALRNIAAVLEDYSNPFDALPFSKWKNEAKGKWMLAVAESIKWAVQRADNQLDPVNAVPIAADEV